MQDYFPDRKTLCTIQGKPNENIVFKRMSRSATTRAINNRFQGLLQDNTYLANGDLVSDGKSYFLVTAFRKSYVSKIAELWKCNCIIDIIELVPVYNASKQKIGDSESILFSSIVAYQENITKAAKQFDPGILDSTVRRFLTNNHSFKINHRIKLNGENYKVEAIDDASHSGLIMVQTSYDTRKTI